MRVVLTSTNKAKRTAVEQVFSQFTNDLELVCTDVDSGVSNTPDTDDEGIKGCIQRIEEGKKHIPDGDLYIGLEGIVTKNNYGTFISGWCCIEDVKTKRYAYGSSAKVQLPPFIADTVTTFKELSELVKNNYDSDLVQEMDAIGSNGVITNRLYTRTDEFEDAILCALGYLKNEKNFV